MVKVKGRFMDNKKLELFEKFVKNELPADQERALKKRLDRDKNLKAEFDIFMRSIKGIKANQLRLQLKDIHRELYPDRMPWYRQRWVWSMAAVLFIMLISISVLKRQSDSMLLYEQYFKPFPNVITGRSQNASSLQRGMALYNSREWEKAILALSSIANDHEDYQTARFYIAVSLLADQGPKEALRIFKQLKNSDYRQQAAWYQALCYVQMGEEETAVLELERIKPGDFNYTMARELLEKLK